MASTAFTFWFLDSVQRDLLDDPDDGLLPARALRRLRDLLPRAVPDPSAEHRARRSATTSAGSSPPPARRSLGLLTSQVYGGYEKVDPALPFRYAGVTMCAVFLIGLIALPFAPETKGKPLPE